MVIAGRVCCAKPPGAGPFPALLWIHGGIVTRPLASVREYALSANPSRFLAAGYVVAAITYRSRDEDPQSTVSLAESLAAIDHLRRLPYVDPKSIVVFGCSGGGDLALEIAAATAVAVVSADARQSWRLCTARTHAVNLFEQIEVYERTQP